MSISSLLGRNPYRLDLHSAVVEALEVKTLNATVSVATPLANVGTLNAAASVNTPLANVGTLNAAVSVTAPAVTATTSLTLPGPALPPLVLLASGADLEIPQKYTGDLNQGPAGIMRLRRLGYWVDFAFTQEEKETDVPDVPYVPTGLVTLSEKVPDGYIPVSDIRFPAIVDSNGTQGLATFKIEAGTGVVSFQSYIPFLNSRPASLLSSASGCYMAESLPP